MKILSPLTSIEVNFYSNEFTVNETNINFKLILKINFVLLWVLACNQTLTNFT